MLSRVIARRVARKRLRPRHTWCARAPCLPRSHHGCGGGPQCTPMVSEVVVRRMSSRPRGGKKAKRGGVADGRLVVKTKQRILEHRAQTFGLLGWAVELGTRPVGQCSAQP